MPGNSVASNALIAEWDSARTPLSEWVRRVEAAFKAHGAGVIDTAELLGCTVVELEAVLRLTLLEDLVLELVSEAAPSMTTWLLLSQVSDAEIPAVLEASTQHREGETDFQAMARAIQAVSGVTPISAVQNLDPTLFEFAYRKAAAYEAWPKDSRNLKALKDFGNRRKSGRPLTSRQTAYAKNLLDELVGIGVIQVPSPDNDDELCRKFLTAIGK